MTQETQIVVKLETSQFDALRKAIPGSTAFVTQSTTELQAGYQLGVQAALQVLRDGFVHER